MSTSHRIQTFDSRGRSNTSSIHDTRNLSKIHLGGVIFGCKASNIEECITKQLFGLPAQHFSYVINITPGMPLFLFNFSNRMLYGIFEAASSGGLNIDPFGMNFNGSRTPFPAQVQVTIRLQCPPLSEKIFKPAILDNYYSQTHFWFELDHDQTRRLIHLFTSRPGSHEPHMHNKNNNMNCRSEEENMVIAQLVQSLEELKSQNLELVKKMDCIEKRQMESEEEIKRLKAKCEVLECALQSFFK